MERESHASNETGIDHEASRYSGSHIPLNSINVLDQPRRTFENIDELAQNIAYNDLLHPLIVARLGLDEAMVYIDTVNKVWKSDHSLDELTPLQDSETPEYYVLLAGERRFRACKHLNSVGCSNCQEAYGEGPCFERHFGDLNIDVRLAVNIDPMQALKIQASENIHMRVPSHEEAYFYDRFYRALKETDPSYSVARFAREVGRSSDTIRTALKYCSLPQDIRIFVDEGHIPYGIAGEVARLQSELGLTEEQLHAWTIDAIRGNYKVPAFREKVSNHIKQQKSGQTLLQIFTTEQEAAMQASHRRKTAAEPFVQETWTALNYFRRVRALFERGLVGQEDSPYSEQSPVRAFKAFTRELRAQLPHMKASLTEREFTEIEDTIFQAEEYLSQLDTDVASSSAMSYSIHAD